jgi:hypothetical protein
MRRIMAPGAAIEDAAEIPISAAHHRVASTKTTNGCAWSRRADNFGNCRSRFPLQISALTLLK